MGACNHPAPAALSRRSRLAADVHIAEGYRQLAIAVLHQAIRDAQSGNLHSAEAQAFLASPKVQALWVELGFDSAQLADFTNCIAYAPSWTRT